MRNSSNPAVTILLYILGIGLVVTAALLVLKGTGLISVIPEAIIWAIALFSIGSGILAGIGSLRR
ncbi:MAG: hypothetical protein BRC40_14610 [Cyanobacteria bacterium QH_8_48_120]|nr:MAG: hypothetical protein BRC34_14245 [Cyanobacteria bacterium QH_1_48_107]PSO53556.1 MAG: hypothetical protein BRC35_15875 [Cyanobacteria bacterium QH_10_48_56]PSO57086.1 MAG: hypothetical protein BRC39_15975 [Cyanobacteria bacterium QH_7_48_89]PSO61193.1 MAG: hypothetical protein BRC36_12265 [Cyanobacteria bacterium QH_2_48_84]PSO65425.1 MAG: hypothetical protein BRC38_08870 [Cyanobacteria bacterium QH_6_48_35]PSO69780.1 MAG: hypothetical protein BRC40_14610 [Cyanobacteria bacterium QH_8_